MTSYDDEWRIMGRNTRRNGTVSIRLTIIYFHLFLHRHYSRFRTKITQLLFQRKLNINKIHDFLNNTNVYISHRWNHVTIRDSLVSPRAPKLNALRLYTRPTAWYTVHTTVYTEKAAWNRWHDLPVIIRYDSGLSNVEKTQPFIAKREN